MNEEPKVIHRRPKRLPRRKDFVEKDPLAPEPPEPTPEEKLTLKEKKKMRSALYEGLEQLSPLERLAVVSRWLHGDELSTLEEATKKFDMSLFRSVSQETIKYLIEDIFSTDRLKSFLAMRTQGEEARIATEAKLKKLVKRGKLRRGKYGNVIGLRVDLGISCKSSTEANFARILTMTHGRDSWQYEPKKYPVIVKGKQDFYIPDFVRTEDETGQEIFYEVKMFFPKGFNGKSKLEAFLSQHPQAKFVFVHLSKVKEMALYGEQLIEKFGSDRIETLCIDALAKTYSKLIPEWEGAVK